jgi:acetylxylan esterase
MAIFPSSLFAAVAALTATAHGALVRVNDFGSNPSNLQMNINVPAKLATNPAIILAVRLPPFLPKSQII